MHKIILVEDEQSLAAVIILNLEMEGYAVKHFSNGGRALEAIDEMDQASLVILDVMLPEVNGIDICRALRQKSAVPVLFLSAKGTSTDRVAGLKSGGTDYLSKPFDLEELILRVQILVGRSAKVEETKLVIGNYTIDFGTFIIANNKTLQEETLSKKEIELLKLFSEKEGQVVSRDEILDRVWGENNYPTSRTVDNFILAFRKRFETASEGIKYFHSVRGVGYKFTNPN